MYKLSPSDFAYLYKDCPHCYYLKVKHQVTPPSMPMPGVFSKLNTLMESDLIGKNLQSIHPSFPDALIVSSEKSTKSQPLPPQQDCFVAGKYDLLAQLPDKTHVVIDLKITTPNQDTLTKYQTQLLTYAYALEHPDEGEPITVSRGAIVAISPDSVSWSGGVAHFTAAPTWLEADMNPQPLLTLVDAISTLLSGPLPEPSPKCNICKYRAKYATANPSVSKEPDAFPF